MIEKVANQINIGKGLNTEQIGFTAMLIIEDEDLTRLKIVEIANCFVRGIKGEFGQLYDRLDSNVIFEWLQTYESRKRFVSAINSEANVFKTQTVDVLSLAAENPKPIKFEDLPDFQKQRHRALTLPIEEKPKYQPKSDSFYESERQRQIELLKMIGILSEENTPPQ